MASTVLNFSRDNLITGINVVGGMLYWTDDRNEPRAIDIETFKAAQHSDGTTEVYGRDFLSRDITVIRPHPQIPLVVTPEAAAVGETSLPFRNVFPRFSYRWIYDSNQASPMAAFSDAAFLAAPYNEEQAYLGGGNPAMINNITDILIGGQSSGIPIGGPDVKTVEILYTESISSTIYVIEEIEVTAAHRTAGFIPRITISARTLQGALPPNQLTRHFDNVPLLAKAQENTASRVIYGNYLQNFEQPSQYQASISMNTGTRPTGDLVSAPTVKSDRTYEVGIAFSGAMGRQGAMIPLGSITTPFFNENPFTLQANVSGTAPAFARRYRYYVKDVSGPHFNLVTTDSYDDAVGSGDASDSSYVWLAFQSRDRNKITDDTVLSMRRDTSAEGATAESVVHRVKSRHPVLDVQNEMPDAVRNQLFVAPDTAATPQDMLSTATLDLRADKASGRFFVKVSRTAEEGSGGSDIPVRQSNVSITTGTGTGANSYFILNSSLTTPATIQYTPLGGTLTSITLGPLQSRTIISSTVPITPPSAPAFPEGAFTTPGTTIAGDTHQIWFETEPVQEDSNLDLYWESANDFGIASFGMDNNIEWTNCIGFFDGSGTSTGLFIEETNIESGFNTVDYGRGVRVNTPQSNYGPDRRSTGLIWSGLFNDNTNINRLNEFITAEGITKEIEPNYGSIQKLHTRDTNLITLCEDKCFRILADKDALFNADGSTNLAGNTNPLGQTTPYPGEYGISTNPESFATYGHRIFFSDQRRGVVMQLTPNNGQLFEISTRGMNDFFRDRLLTSTRVIGAYDDYDNAYDITIYGNTNDTVTYNLDTETWVSRRSYISEGGMSANNVYYTFNNGRIYEHNSNSIRNNFYGTQYNSTMDFIFNDSPSAVKEFTTLGYEGMEGWTVTSLTSDMETSDILQFVEKEGKFYSSIGMDVFEYEIAGTTAAIPAASRLATDIVNNGFVLRRTTRTRMTSGIKGVTLDVSLMNTSTDDTAELYAVNTDFFVSS